MPGYFYVILWTTLGVGALVTWLVVLVRLGKSGSKLQREAAPLQEAAQTLKVALAEERILLERLKSKKESGN